VRSHYDRLHACAEDAAAADVPIEEALLAVHDGYSSTECDRIVAEDLADDEEGS